MERPRPLVGGGGGVGGLELVDGVMGDGIRTVQLSIVSRVSTKKSGSVQFNSLHIRMVSFAFPL